MKILPFGNATWTSALPCSNALL